MGGPVQNERLGPNRSRLAALRCLPANGNFGAGRRGPAGRRVSLTIGARAAEAGEEMRRKLRNTCERSS